MSAVLDSIRAYIDEQNIDRDQPTWKTDLPAPPEASFDDGKTYTWTLKTNKGDMKFRLLTDVAPRHAASTLYLSMLGFYDDLSFHRVIDGFMAQGGCPLGTGTGGPGYRYNGEFSPSARHDKRGLLSMANAGPGTDGSQFFITFVETPHLDDNHTIFGELVDGEGTLDALESAGSRSGQPSEELMILESTVSAD